MQGKTIGQLSIGEQASFSKTISESDIYNFAGVTGDMNPMHINQEYAATTSFGKRIAHGILAVGFISNVLGTQLPGTGVIYLEQKVKFLKPVAIGDTVTATVEVTKIDESKNLVWLRTYCTNQKKETVVDGEALMMPKKEG